MSIIGLKPSMTQECQKCQIGDIIIDSKNKDIGILLRRYNLFEGGYYSDNSDVITMVWDIYWVGPSVRAGEANLQTYTEEGVDLLFASGSFVLYKNI